MAALLVAACSNVPKLPPVLPVGAPASAPTDTAIISDTVPETYLRVARAANQCWFGPVGALSSTYVFYADAENRDDGGSAEIIIHERVYGEPRPWGLKAFRILLQGESGRTVVSTVNLKVPEPLGARMHDDVIAWARGSQVCLVREAAAALSPPQPAVAPAAAPPPVAPKSAKAR